MCEIISDYADCVDVNSQQTLDNQWCLIVGPASQTLDQQLNSIGLTSVISLF